MCVLGARFTRRHLGLDRRQGSGNLNLEIDQCSEESWLFFWLFPPGPQGSTDDLIVW